MGEILRKFVSESGNIYACINCDFHLAKEADLISKLFQGQSGPAYLFTDAYNILTDSLEQEKYMTTGKHIISTIRCAGCHCPIGWVYLYAYTQDQKYKEDPPEDWIMFHRTFNTILHSRSRARRPFASAHHGPVPFNEPGGSLFKSEKGQPVDWAQKIYITFYLGGLAAFAFLWQFKPDTSAESWAREVAMKRMKERGVDLSSIDK